MCPKRLPGQVAASERNDVIARNRGGPELPVPPQHRPYDPPQQGTCGTKLQFVVKVHGETPTGPWHDEHTGILTFFVDDNTITIFDNRQQQLVCRRQRIEQYANPPYFGTDEPDAPMWNVYGRSYQVLGAADQFTRNYYAQYCDKEIPMA